MLWKAVERKHSALLGGSGRTGPTGRDIYDWEHPILAPESKQRAKIPGWIQAALDQASANAAGKVPIVIWHQTNTRYKNDVVMLRLADFKKLSGVTYDTSSIPTGSEPVAEPGTTSTREHAGRTNNSPAPDSAGHDR